MKIYIPNSFIQLDKNNILISDSHMSKVFIFEFDDSGKFISRYLNESLNMTPDKAAELMIAYFYLIK